MSVFDVVGQSFDVIKKNPIVILPYLVYVAVVIILALIFVGYAFSSIHPVLSTLRQSMTGANFTTARAAFHVALTSLPRSIIPSIIIGLIVFVIIVLLIAVFLSGIYVSIGSDFIKNKKISLSAAYETVKARYVDLICAVILACLICLALTVIFVLLIIAASAILPIAILIGIIFVVLLIWLEILFFQIGPVVIIEGKTAVAAVQRSIEIGSEHIWSILGLFVVLIVIDVIIGLAGSIPIIGSIISIVGAILFGITVMLTLPVFYCLYVAKKTKAATPKRRKK